MLRFSKCFAILMTLGSAVHAQSQQCPVPFWAGPWVGTQIGGTDFDFKQPPGSRVSAAMAKLMFENMAEAMSLNQAGSKGLAEFSGDMCDGTFDVTIEQMVFPLKRQANGKYRGGTQIAGAVTFDMEIEVKGDNELTSEMKSALVKSTTGFEASWAHRMQFVYAGTEKRPWACQCPDRLQAYIDEKVQEATVFRDIYAIQKLWARPSGVAKADWNGSLYDDLVGFVADAAFGGASNPVSKGRADFNSWWGQSSATNTTAESQNKNLGVAGSINMVNCNIKKLNKENSCFPTIGNESTRIHENTHKDDCLDVLLGGSGDTHIHFNIPKNFAQTEINAYQAEIDFLTNWIPNNCG